MFPPFYPDPKFPYDFPVERMFESVTAELIARRTQEQLTGNKVRIHNKITSWAYVNVASKPELHAELDPLVPVRSITLYSYGKRPMVAMKVNPQKDLLGLIPAKQPANANHKIFFDTPKITGLFEEYLNHLQWHLIWKEQLKHPRLVKEKLLTQAKTRALQLVRLDQRFGSWPKGMLFLHDPWVNSYYVDLVELRSVFHHRNLKTVLMYPELKSKEELEKSPMTLRDLEPVMKLLTPSPANMHYYDLYLRLKSEVALYFMPCVSGYMIPVDVPAGHAGYTNVSSGIPWVECSGVPERTIFALEGHYNVWRKNFYVSSGSLRTREQVMDNKLLNCNENSA